MDASRKEPSTAMTAVIGSEGGFGIGTTRLETTSPGAAFGRWHFARRAVTLGSLMISRCPILLARSMGRRPRDPYAMSPSLPLGGASGNASSCRRRKAIDLDRNDERIRICLHPDEALVS